MTEEIKQGETPEVKPVGGTLEATPSPSQSPSAEELRKQNEELQKQLKERDTHISDLQTTKATIEARQKELESARQKEQVSVDTNSRIQSILEQSAYDSAGAAREMSKLLSEVGSTAAREAVMHAQQAMTVQTTMEKLRTGVKTTNPDFDDDIVDVVMTRAESLAQTGKYKTADEAIKAATDFVKSKFESYAQKKNSAPPLPAGALAENGSNPPPVTPPPERVPSALEELESRKSGLQKKVL